jgi:AraC-like DNA-binding protein
MFYSILIWYIARSCKTVILIKMEEHIPKYNIDFRKLGQDQFFIHLHEKSEQGRPAITVPHSHNYYCISFLYEGEMVHFADLGNTVISAPALLLLDIDQVHIHADLNEGCRLMTISFSSEFIYRQSRELANYIEAVFSRPYIILSEEEMRELDKYNRLISQENSRGNHRNVEIIKCLLNIVLIQCAALSQKEEKPDFDKIDLFSHFKTAVNKYFRDKHQVKFYADQLNITTSVLTEIVKKTSNKTPKQVIDERLFTEARRLLYWSNITVREVAWDLGFKTDGYFIKFFKKFEGITPKDFQKNSRIA